MAKLRSGLDEIVADDEEIARFLTSSGYFNSRSAKPPAFQPDPADGKTSVYRHGGSPPDELWQIASDHLGKDRRVHGAAILTARSLRLIHLDVESSEPPPRHADIVNWPTDADSPEEQKSKQKLLALQLCASARLVMR